MNNQATHGMLAPATSSRQESSRWDRCGGRNPACPTNNPDDQTSSLGTSGKLAVDCYARNPAAFYSRKEVIGDCTLYQADCLELMPHLGVFDAVVTDPPHGIGESGGKSAGRSKLANADLYEHKDWDAKTLDDHISYAVGIAKNSIVFGGNYYHLPPTSCWLIWDKENGANDFADCEMAWTNLPKAVRRIKWLWNGMIRKGDDVRQHPTQKPLGVIEWCIGHLPKESETVLDPFMGSGTTLVACAKLGRKGVGIELDADYFDIACERVAEAYRQPDLFVAPPKPPVQEGFDL